MIGPLFDTLLFDVDGTLIDSNGAHAEAWTRSLREHGMGIDPDHIRRLIGMGGDKLLPAIANVAEGSNIGRAVSRRKKLIFETLLPQLQPTRGARPLLEYLSAQRVEIIVATSADDREMRALLRQAGVDDLIPHSSSKDDASRSKPDPDIIQAALAKAKGRRERTALVGDTPYDIESAARAGIPTIALRCGGYWTDDSLKDAVGIFDDPQAFLASWRRSDM